MDQQITEMAQVLSLFLFTQTSSQAGASLPILSKEWLGSSFVPLDIYSGKFSN